jgi:MFS family permease
MESDGRGSADSRWLILVVLFSARTAIAFQFQSVAALGPVLVEQVDMDYASLGALVGLFMLPGMVLSLPGGLLGQRFGDKSIACWGLALMALGGLVVAVSDGIMIASAGRIVSGIGAVLLNILLAKMVTDWFVGREIVMAMALFLSSWPIGIGLALLLLPPVAEATSTQLALSSTAVVSGTALLLILTVYRPPTDAAQTVGKFRFGLNRREWLLSSFAGLVWGFYNVGFILVLAFGPPFFVDGGMSISVAGATASAVTWTIVISLPLFGYFASRGGSADGIMIGSFIVLAMLITGLSFGFSPLLLCVAIGFVAGAPAGLIMALPSEVLRPENRSAGMGLYFTWYYGLMTLLIPAAGVVRETTTSSSSPLLFGAAMMLLALVCLVLFRAGQRLWTPYVATVAEVTGLPPDQPMKPDTRRKA